MFEATNYSSIPNMNIKLYKDLFQELLEQYGRDYAVNSLFCALMDFSDEKDRIYNSKEPPVDFVSLQNVYQLAARHFPTAQVTLRQ